MKLDRYNLFVRVFLLVALLCANQAFGVEIKVEPKADTLHLEFSGQSSYQYSINKKVVGGKHFVELTVPAFKPANVQELEKLQHSFVKEVKVNPKGPDGQFVITAQVADKDVEVFEYLTDEPSRLIVDFFRKKETALKEASETIATSDLVQELPAKKPKKESGSERKLASDQPLLIQGSSPEFSVSAAEINPAKAKTYGEGIFDGSDPNFLRFSVKDFEVKPEAIAKSRINYYLQFPMYELPSKHYQSLVLSRPVYNIVPKDGEENKQALLLKTLFDKKRYRVFMKTLELFTASFPNSQYHELFAFMRADILFNTWIESKEIKVFEAMVAAYQEALQKHPESILKERTELLIGFETARRGDHLKSIQLMQKFADQQAQSRYRDVARLSIADSFSKISRFSEAEAMYKLLTKEGKPKSIQVEAQYRLGDVAMRNKNFALAVANYTEALEKYKSDQVNYPNAFYNRAAGLFELKDYRKSLDQYRDFFVTFPSDRSAPFAMTRAGELLQILGADEAKVMGAYLETFFRYGDRPEAIVARLRMLSQKIVGMRSKELEQTIKEIQTLSEKMKLPNIDQFTTVILADGFTRQGDFERAKNMLTEFFQRNPTTVNKPLFTQRIISNISNTIQEKVDSGDFIGAMNLHQSQSNNWLKGSERIDNFFNLGRAFETAGDDSQAKYYYQQALNRMDKIKGTDDEALSRLIENLPTREALALRQAVVQKRLGENTESLNRLKSISSSQGLTAQEQVERADLAAQLFESKGDYASAERFLSALIEEWTNSPELLAPAQLRLARLRDRAGSPEEALKILRSIGEVDKESKSFDAEIYFSSLVERAAIEERTKKPAELMLTLTEMVNNFNDKKSIDSYRYKLGLMNFEKGEIKKAEDVWAPLKATDSSWGKMAAENMNSKKFQDDYNKYSSRIPAMSNQGGKQ